MHETLNAQSYAAPLSHCHIVIFRVKGWSFSHEPSDQNKTIETGTLVSGQLGGGGRPSALRWEGWAMLRRAETRSPCAFISQQGQFH